jgi:ribosomal 30S subunit maturation factor RimM
VFRVGESEVYVVRGGARGEILVPAVRSIVLELGPAERRMVVDEAALGLSGEEAEE